MEQNGKTSDAMQTLVRRAKDGDRGAMEEIYLATYSELWRTVRAMSKNDADAMDVMQETYLSAFTHLSELKKEEQVSAWLKRIAVNEVRRQLRKKQPLLFSELSDEEDALPPEPVSSQTPEYLLERKEQAAIVQQLLSKLPDGQRTVLILYYCEQYSVREIAQQLGVSQGTVKTQLHYGRKKLENAMRKSKDLSLVGLTAPMLLSGWRGAQTPPTQLGTGTTVTRLLPQAVPVTVQNGTTVVLGRIAAGVLAAALLVGLGFGTYRISSLLREKELEYSPPPTSPILEAAESTDPKPETPVMLHRGEPAVPVLETEEAIRRAETAEAAPKDEKTDEPQPTEPKPTEPKPTEPKATEPKPTQPQPAEPKPTDPQPTQPQPTEPEPTEPQPTEQTPLPASPADAPGGGELPSQNPYPFSYQEVTLPVGSVWHTSFKTDAEWRLTPFIHTPNLSTTSNLSDSVFSNGEQRIAIVLNQPGVFVYTLVREDLDAYVKLVRITVTEKED